MVFGVTAIASVLFVIWGIVGQDSLSSASSAAQGWVITNLGWFYVLAASVFVIFVLWLAVSRYGGVRLGADDEKPEFKTVSWIAMMFSAGMGIGLMFFGAAEPLSFFTTQIPPGTEGATEAEAIRTAMATSLFHWGLHPWAIYAVVAIAIAYGAFRKGRRQLISAAFWPLFGRKSEGWFGKVVDCLAIFATLFGSAASLGLGALQIGAGIQFLGWVENPGVILLVGIIVILTIAFIASAVSGIAKGIQWLANINMVLALALAIFVFVAGPTLLILNLLPTTLGEYLDQIIYMSSRTGADGGDAAEWLSGWTIFYWAWWISWTPFVGLFIARISRGRTIRQVVTGLLIVPTLVSLVWFSVFGGTAIDLERSGSSLLMDGEVQSDFVLFQLLENYPLASVTTVLVMILVAIFFVSGADAASVVMGGLSERGAEEPRRLTVVFWGAVTGAVAAIMLSISPGGDALSGLQNLTILVSLPFVVVMLLLCVALVKDLANDPWIARRRVADRLTEDAVVTGVTEHGPSFAVSLDKAESVVDHDDLTKSFVVDEYHHRLENGEELPDNEPTGDVDPTDRPLGRSGTGPVGEHVAPGDPVPGPEDPDPKREA
ncbi:BCCT family transporter [Naumannella halotolerans]|uniref:BCCT family transporter n=1 Tax=Naumannella halotolerans TaxID=993414 RepID=UPI00370DCAFA